MRRILKVLALFLLALLIIIQFVHPAKNVTSGDALFANDISKVYPVPDDIQLILRSSCYDCHSNNTKYPWYSKIQPVAWWLNDHIVEGKKELNFTEFASYNIRRKFKKIEEILEEVEEDKMPLYSYTLLHKNAILDKDQKSKLMNWATAIRDTMKANYPADSLVKK